MGACASTTSSHRGSGSAMKLGITFDSKLDKLSSIPPSPVKPPTNVGRPIADQMPSPALSTAFAGSKEDAFFDSKPWLDSDCDDDFYSVNGDFTPSRGNTPVHHNFSRVNKTPFGNRSPVSIPAISPVVKKKKLADLFRESFGDEDDVVDVAKDAVGDQTMTNGNMEAKAIVEDVSEDRPIKSTQCCLPTFVSFRSSSQIRKTSPTIVVADKA